MPYLAIKFTKSAPYRLVANRLHVKAFPGANALGAFLCKQTDNTWNEAQNANTYPQKTGVYRYAGGQWHNEKHLDASVLAHI